MIAPDPVGKPQSGQRVGGRERITGLLGGGQGLACGRVRRV